MTPEAQRHLDQQWQRLLDILNSWCTATSAEPGRIDVRLPEEAGARRDVTIVMTPDEWDDMWSVAWGNVDDAANDIKQTLLGLGPLEEFAVYSQYRLEPSTTPALAERPEGPPPSGGTWVAYDRDGRVTSRFADWTDPDGAY